MCLPLTGVWINATSLVVRIIFCFQDAYLLSSMVHIAKPEFSSLRNFYTMVSHSRVLTINILQTSYCVVLC